MTHLLDDLVAFVEEHRRCGLLDSEVTRNAGECGVTFVCDYGAQISHAVESQPPERG